MPKDRLIIVWGSLIAFAAAMGVMVITQSGLKALLVDLYILYLTFGLWLSRTYIGPKWLAPVLYRWRDMSVDYLRLRVFLGPEEQHRYQWAFWYLVISTSLLTVLTAIVALAPLVIYAVLKYPGWT